MKIAVMGDDDQWTELTNSPAAVNWIRISSLNKNISAANAYIILDKPLIEGLENIHQPILINSVTATLKKLNAPSNVLRINGWKGFLSRAKWEVAGRINEAAEKVFSAMQKEIFMVADEPGLVAARSIAMIINEAYFTLEQSVSTKDEIDTAMKLGTNYPLGPFEWASIIGLRNIYDLLNSLNDTDARYFPSLLLKKEAAT